MALILGIDRFMSECRSLTNFIGNAVATVVVARWDKALDKGALDAALHGTPRAATGGPSPAKQDIERQIGAQGSLPQD
jgi:aerobic C4-dicarboxylate transport protein